MRVSRPGLLAGQRRTKGPPRDPSECAPQAATRHEDGAGGEGIDQDATVPTPHRAKKNPGLG
jgi:hypothetical protein